MWQQPVSIISYLFVATIVVWLSIKLSTFVDLLDKKTNVSGALLGGILLAATTSLPELFTSLTATLLVNNNSLVMGNILGSNLFNMVLFSIIYLGFFSKVVKNKVDKIHIFTMTMVGLSYTAVIIASYVFDFNNLLWGWFNPMSIAILFIYGINILKTPKEDNDKEEEEDEKESKLTVKQIIILFVIFALALIGASIGMTYLTEWIVEVWGLGSTFGGALFLGVATSLPEMTATINLSRRGNINAAYGNVCGSISFNFSIMALADLISFNCSARTYTADQSAFLLMVFGGAGFILLIISLIVKLKGNLKGTMIERIYFYITGGLIAANYIAFLILSNINLGLSFAPYISA